MQKAGALAMNRNDMVPFSARESFKGDATGPLRKNVPF